jgi:hypothetical protein
MSIRTVYAAMANVPSAYSNTAVITSAGGVTSGQIQFALKIMF